ncbi:S-methyl-5-thioribose-1-phosphate isomerase [Thiohalorhabdus methylotrophus]|uniref:Methylthioribose-1-phosphate isomerase n=1 Tax=Thiohalorhabdus methylotrophus TaxID=3242694 RepID=A0ABV4TUW6_9GAMM
MRVDGVPYRTIWLAEDGWSVDIIDQTRLPWEWRVARLASMEAAAEAIRSMRVRGAPLIGATAAYGLCLALRADASDAALERAHDQLLATRPTAVNLRWALEAMRERLGRLPPAERVEAAYAQASEIAEGEVETCRWIGDHGLALIEAAHRAKGEGPVNVLTHCNAGWLACVDWGTALAPIYRAHDAGIPVHVWVDETRPRNQGAALTAWELGRHGVPHTLVADNAGGHLMQHGRVDLCLVGTDRTTRSGDVANKIGTYLKALAAREAQVPFYVALPGSTIDWTVADGLAEVPIEERSQVEVTHISGRARDGLVSSVAIAPEGTPAVNPAFDITPASLVTALVTERGVCAASEAGLAGLYPERSAS